MTQTKKRSNLPVNAPSRALASKRNDTYERPLIFNALRSGLWGTGATLASGLTLITATTAVAYANPDPTAIIPFLGIAALLVSCFVGGFVSTKVSKESPLLCGTVTGGITALISLVLSLILFALPSSGLAFWLSLLLHGAALAFSILGAFAGSIKLSSRRSKRRFG